MPRTCRRSRALLALLALVSLALPAAAHDPGLSSLVVRVGDAAIDVALRVNEQDLDHPLGAAAVQLRVPERELAPERLDALQATAGEQGLLLRYGTPPPSRLTLTSRLLAELPPGHRQYARIEDGRGALIADAMLSRTQPSLHVALDGRADSEPRSALAFVRLGAEHILEGYDHLLFLFVLLLACSSWRAVLRVVTAFTLGHSLSLAAATLGWIALPSDVVEPAIAASIVYVALASLTRSGQAERLVVTLAFGLIHGLGFAGALAELGVARGGRDVVAPLLAFNAGVELGQLALAALSLPILTALRRHPFVHRRALPAATACAAALGFLWLLERTLMA